MARFRPAAYVWFGACAVVALLTTALTLRQLPTTPHAWAGLALLGLCAAVAHRFPTRATSNAPYRLTNVFLTAGALILPLGLLAPLVLLALGPDILLGGRRSSFIPRLLAHVPPTILAVHAGGAMLHRAGIVQIVTPRDLAGVLIAATALNLGQNLLIGVGMALNLRLPLRRVETLSRTALLSDALFGGLGIAVAGLWLASPLLLLLVLPLLITAHQLTRTAHLARLAQIDTKTGLGNARHFEQLLDEEITRSLRLGQPLAVLFIDLDHFKEINDNHGHANGDLLLQEFAALLTATLRAGDVVARFGGEEFVALLPDTDPEHASFLAELVRTATMAHRFTLHDGTRLQRTVSIGIATCPHDATTVEALLKQSDLAMYRAKETRNAIVHSAMLPSVPRLHRRPEESPAAAAAPGVPPTRTWHAPALLWGTVALGSLILAASLVALVAGGEWLVLLPYLALAVAAEFLSVSIFERQSQKITLSFGIAVVMATVVALPAGAPLVASAGAVVHIIRQRQWQRGGGRMLFNLTNAALAAALAVGVYLPLLPYLSEGDWWPVVATALATCGYYVSNVGIIALTVSAHSGRPLGGILRDSLWATPTTLLLGLTGAYVSSVYSVLDSAGALLFVVPLLVMRFTLAYAARKNKQAISTLETAKEEVEQAHAEKEQTLRQLISTVAAIIDARDQTVAGHSDRVARYAVALGEELGLAARELAYLHTAGLLHDLGKVAIPETILHKPAKLTDEEYTLVKEHAATGERILAEVQPLLAVALMVGDHHERFDGRGYPNGQAGMTITQGGRILAVADTLDSILSDRPYSRGKPLHWALEEVDRCEGSHFDPEVVAALRRVVARNGPGFFAASAATGYGSVEALRGTLIPFPSGQHSDPQPGSPPALAHSSSN